MDQSSSYGGQPQSTIGNSARRIQSQLPAEPPACVQNAMMRRDKQPFTYTPGGIDLSQIKSPRMAKRISRNAQSEGVSNQPKLSPLAQNNSSSSSNSNNSQTSVSPAATLGAAAMGMPFQVFPTGPPAPPPPPPPSMNNKQTAGQATSFSAPAPPPPPPPTLSTEKKTQRPQSFEPPPMGCRPEIKIPPNPMANLRKAPRPQPKNDFWIEEYRKERQLDADQPTYNPTFSNREVDEEVAKNIQNRTDELTVAKDLHIKRSPSPSNLTKPLENGSRVSTIKTPPVYSQSPVPPNLPPPITPTKVSHPQSVNTTNPIVTSQQDNEQSLKPQQHSPSSTPTPSANGTTNTGSSKTPTPQKPPQPLGSLYIPPVHEVFANSKQTLLNQTSPPWMSSRQNSVKEQPEWVHKGEPEYPEPKSQASKSNSNESTTKTLEPIAADTPSPAKPTPVPQQHIPPSTPQVSRPQAIDPPSVQQPAISQTHYIQLQNPTVKIQPVVQQSPIMPGSRSYPQSPVYVQNQVYSPQPATSQKERIIPIQVEQSPAKTPASTPGFAPPPYYSPGPQYSVQSPITVGYHSGFTTPTAMFTNPNHFVNQGYNNITYPPTSPQQTMYQQHHQHYPQHHPTPQQHQHIIHQHSLQQQQMPAQQPGGVRIIPIKVEGGDNGMASSTTVRGPLSQTPAIIQCDPRSGSNTQSWNGNITPNQSRSFRVLQHITDTAEDVENRSKPSTPKPAVGEQQPQMSTGPDGAESQLRRMQLSNDDKALMNRVKNQVDDEVYLHKEEDPRYRGAAIPSKAFRYLQSMTDGSQATNPGNTGSTNRANQMFVQNRGILGDTENDSSQQYIPPSEQRVEEPKKYTGSAIPSRSFKMLQAMTQSDAPAETNSSDIEGNQNLPCNGDIQYSPYPYPLQHHYCCNPNWHYYDPNNPQYYPHPPPPLPPPHHAPGYYYPPPPHQHPHHGHYDRGAYYAGYMSPHNFYYPQEPCSPCTPPPYYQLSQPQVAYCENTIPESPTHTYVITTPPPRIEITPSADNSDAESVLNEINDRPHPLTRSQSSLKRLSERLANFTVSPEKIFPVDLQDPLVCCSPSSPLNERYRTFEESTSSATSSQSECSDSEEDSNQKLIQTTIQGKRDDTEIIKQEQQEVMKHEEQESSEESEDEETVGYESTQPEHLPHQLSVIFEEDSVYTCSVNPSRRTSVCSNSSTLSDCSSTLANDLDNDAVEDTKASANGGNHTDDDIDRMEDEECNPNDQSQLSSTATSCKQSSRVVVPNHDESDASDSDEENTEEETVEHSSNVNGLNTSNVHQNPDTIKISNQSDDNSTDSSEEESESESDTDETDDEKDCNDVHTDVTVTITIPSMSGKSINETKDNPKSNEELLKPNFVVDYEDDTQVSVSVSLPLKTKPSTIEGTVEAIKTEECDISDATAEKEAQQEDDEEIDFWSQIGEEDDYSRPSRSYSRDFWSSREVSIDRDSVWNQNGDEDDEKYRDDGEHDFWDNGNGPTEAIDLWKADPVVESFLQRQKNENATDSLEFWQKENERLVNDLYSKKNESNDIQKGCRIMDENNNSSTWDKVEQLKETTYEGNNNGQRNDITNIASVKESDNDSDTDDSDEGSEDESEDYETTNTSKEDSDADVDDLEKNEHDTLNTSESLKIVLEEIVEKEAATGIDHITTKVDEKTLTVRDRISLFENHPNSPLLEVPTRRQASNSSCHLRPPSVQKLSCDESEAEDDSGVTSDMSKHISEVETDSEFFPEMRKMTRYQRAATHSRLFKLLQDESNNGDSEDEEAEKMTSVECNDNHKETNQDDKAESLPRVKMNQHKDSSSPVNSSNTNTAADRRDRLSLPIRHQSSSGIESLSSSTSSASPVSGVMNEKLAEELVQSLLMKKKGRLFRNLPLERLHAAALKILQEDLESNGTISSNEDNITTVDSTPALTPQEFKSEYQNSYSDYYDTWSETNGKASPHDLSQLEAAPSKALRSWQEHSTSRKTGGWTARCPRVLSNKSISRLADVRESNSPEPSTISRSRPPSRASNQSPFPPMSGLIEELPSSSRSAYRQCK